MLFCILNDTVNEYSILIIQSVIAIFYELCLLALNADDRHFVCHVRLNCDWP